MKKIRNYNPNLGLTLNDIKMLLLLDEMDEYGFNYTYKFLNDICQSVEEETTFEYGGGIQSIYDNLMGKVEPAVEEYEKQLLEQGYTQEDIDEYHTHIRERHNSIK